MAAVEEYESIPPQSKLPAAVHRKKSKSKSSSEMTMKENRNFKDEKIPRLRQAWFHRYDRLFQEQPLWLPPERPVKHHIPLIEPDKQYAYYLPKCPDYLCVELLEKIKKYTEAGWWIPVATHQATPMLCILKKNKQLWTAVDLQKQNNNTYKDVTPFPDQDHIQNDVAHAQYCTKIDLTNAYEQILVAKEDLPKTAFATVFGTFLSQVMQIGDCNVPATFQTLMTHIFHDYLGRFVNVYLDDIVVYSDTIDDHEEQLKLVFSKLVDNEFYLQQEKVELYADNLDCLGHTIDGKGIHVAETKMHTIRDRRTPRLYNDVQRFLGLVQYIAHFLPEVANYTGPLAAMNRRWAVISMETCASTSVWCNKAPV